MEIAHEIISKAIFLLLIQEGLLSVTNESIFKKYRLVKLVQGKKMWLGELPVPTWLSEVHLILYSKHNNMGESFQDYSWIQDFEADFT